MASEAMMDYYRPARLRGVPALEAWNHARARVGYHAALREFPGLVEAHKAAWRTIGPMPIGSPEYLDARAELIRLSGRVSATLRRIGGLAVHDGREYRTVDHGEHFLSRPIDLD